MATHAVVRHDKWLAARKKHLAKEKEFTRLRDQLSKERRELPWELVEKEYVFEGEHGFDAWLRAMGQRGASLNFGSFLGATTVRQYVMGMEQGNKEEVGLAQDDKTSRKMGYT